MSDIKNDVKKAIYFVFAIILILIVLTTLVFGCSGDLTPIKSALSLMGNYVGGITTLAAAYIASLLFNDWRGVHKAQHISLTCEKLKDSILNLNSKIFDLEIILDSTDFLRDGLHIAFVTNDKKDEIRNLIPSIKSSCKQITHDIRHLESEILSLKYISMDAFIKINLLYSDLNKTVDINYKKVLANRDANNQLTILGSCKKFISISSNKLKNLQDVALNEINKLNSPK